MCALFRLLLPPCPEGESPDGRSLRHNWEERDETTVGTSVVGAEGQFMLLQHQRYFHAFGNFANFTSGIIRFESHLRHVVFTAVTVSSFRSYSTYVTSVPPHLSSPRLWMDRVLWNGIIRFRSVPDSMFHATGIRLDKLTSYCY